MISSENILLLKGLRTTRNLFAIWLIQKYLFKFSKKSLMLDQTPRLYHKEYLQKHYHWSLCTGKKCNELYFMPLKIDFQNCTSNIFSVSWRTKTSNNKPLYLNCFTNTFPKHKTLYNLFLPFKASYVLEIEYLQQKHYQPLNNFAEENDKNAYQLRC